MKLRDVPLGLKVSAAIFAAIGISMLLVASTLWLYERQAVEPRLRTSLEVAAEPMLATVAPAVEFNVPEAAAEALARLKAANFVVAATVLRPGEPARRFFAGYVRDGQTVEFDHEPRADGFYRSADRGLLVTTLRRDGQTVATLQIEGSLKEVGRGMERSLAALAVIFVLMLGLGALLSRWLGRAITGRIAELARTAEDVRTSADFGLRVRADADDEIGRLGRQLNALLQAVELRDRQIAESAAMREAILAGTGVAVIACDAQGTVQSFNPAAETMLGFKAAEVVGRVTPLAWHDPDEICLRAEELARGGRARIAPGFGVFVALIEAGETAREWTYVRRDGRRFPAHVVVSPLRGRDGRLLGYVGVATDLTHRKAAEQALRASEERFRLLAESPLVGILVHEDGVVRYANPGAANLAGYERGDALVGRHVSEFIDEGDLPELAARLRMLAAGENPGPHAAFRIRRQGGGEAWAQTVPTLIEWNGRRAVQVFLVDMTQQRAAEEAMRASEERHRLVIEQTGQLVYDVDLVTGRIEWFGTEAVRLITGYSLPEFQAVTLLGWAELIHPEDRAAALAEFERCRGSGLRYETAYRFRRSDGSYRMVSDLGVFVQPKDGAPTRMLGVMSDISERYAAGERLRQSERKFATIFAQSPDLLLVADAAEGRLIDVNQAFLEKTGWSRADALGRTVEELAFCTDPRLCAEGMRTALAEGQWYHSDFGWQSRDRRGHSGTLSLRRIEVDGRPAVNAVVHDTSAQRRQERALRAFSELTAGVTGQEFFRTVVARLCAEIGVRYALIGEIVGSGDRPQVRSVAAWGDGGPVEISYELAGTPCENVTRDGLCHIADAVADRFPDDPVLRQMGARSYAGLPIRSHTGETLGLVAVLDDKPMPDSGLAALLLVIAAARAGAEIQRLRAAQEIIALNAALERRVAERTTELAHRVAEVERLNGEQQALLVELRASQQTADRAASRLQEVNSNLLAANQELEAFSYSVSHDLRAPLRNIAGFIELLTKRTAGRLDGESQRFVAVVDAEARRMGMLIDDLLTFSRIGRAELNQQSVALGELIAEVRDELRPDTDGRAIEWAVGPLPRVRGDRALLRQVVANLLSNAVKFTRPAAAARIEIGTGAGRADDPQVTVYVRDNGAGFNPKYLDKLFGVFQRLHNTREFEGTGIGLANVKRIVTRHGGRVWAEGQPGKGATFYFTVRRD